MDHLTLAELLKRYDQSQDDDEISALEDEIASRQGYATVDEEWSAYGADPTSTTNRSTYTRQTVDEDAVILKSQPFYLEHGDGRRSYGSTAASILDQVQSSEGDETTTLCDICSHLDFRYMLTHLVPMNELSLGSLSNVSSKQHCAFCRLVITSIRLALCSDEVLKGENCNSVEVGLRSVWHVGDTDQYNLEILLHPWPRDTYPSIYIQHVSTDELPPPFSGRMLDSSQISFATVKQWLNDCERNINSHKPVNSISKEDFSFVPSYLINVTDDCVISPAGPCRYLALSYVWGGPQPLQLLLENVEALKLPGALRRLPSALPATIADAMQLVRELGEKFLWVDALCIVQDDYKLKEPELRSMDQLYADAVLTIVASHGNNVHAGLPGIRAGTRNAVQHVEIVQGIKLANRLLACEGTVNRSVWNTRAWTYQERILARRKLFVSDQQVSFKCEHTEVELCEDVNSLPSQPSQQAWRWGEARSEKWKLNYESLDDPIPLGGVNTAVYAGIVQRFTSRSVSFPSDILNAFAGVSQRLAPLFKGSFRFGLPKNELDTQLLWQPQGAIGRRVDEKTGLNIFPSWSWAGWVGPVTGVTAGGQLSSDIEFKHDITDQWFTMEQCRGIALGPSPTKWTLHEWRGQSFWQQDDNEDMFYAHPVAKLPFSKALRPRLIPNLQGSAQLLPMRASVASFYIDGRPNPQATSYLVPSARHDLSAIHTVMLLDRSDKTWAGTVFVPADFTDGLQKGDFDCIKINTADPIYEAEEAACLIPFASCYDNFHFEEPGNTMVEINLLLVRYEGEIAVRIGAGVCHIKAFEQACPERREILLG